MQPVDFDPFAGDAVAGTPAPARLVLTAAQREMLGAVQMSAEASCAYNQCLVLRLQGNLSQPSMQRALAQVVARHESLRLRIHSETESQEVLDDVAVVLPLVDLSAASAAERAAAIARLLDIETHTAFDLEAAPLWRAQVVRESADACQLIFTAHHIVCDGWSSAVIFGDLAKCYAADRFGLPPALPAAASLREYVAAADTPDARAELQAAEAFWVAQYAGGVPAFELPPDNPRPRLKTFASAREVLRMDAALYAAVKQMGAKQGCTLFVTLLAAFEALLARLSGSDELVVGVPMANQALLENGHLVAHGVNTIALRAAVNLQQPFTEHLLGTRKRFLDAQAHQSLTFGSLVQHLKLPRDPSRTPLVNVTFNIDKLGAPFDFGELALQGIDAPKAFANFELAINAVDSGRDVQLECDYNAALFDATTVQRWLALYGAMLERLVAAPALALADALAPTAADTQRLAAFNNTQAEWPSELRIEALMARQVATMPEQIAVIAGERQLNYRELDQRANGLAARLRSLGVGRGNLVGLACGRNEHMVVALVGILKSGAGYVPLDPSFPTERLEFMASDAGLRQLVCDRSSGADLAMPGIERLVLDDIPAQPDGPAPAGNADDVAYVIYTSGSTGRPKGVLVPHRSVTNLLESVRREPGMKAGQTVLAVTTLSFDIAVSEVILPLTVGARIVVADRDEAGDGERLRRLVEVQRVDFIDATPSTWRLLLGAGWQGSPALTAICTGEPLPPDLGQALLPRVGQLWNGYGPTETTVWSSFHRVESMAGPVPIGQPIANTAFHIVDASMRPVPIGVTGEIVIGGSGVTLGYLNRPDLTAERFLADPFSTAEGARLYRTGDLGRWRADGVLECQGRIDHQVKVRGHRIELGEIEANLLAHPQVKQALVLVREDTPGDQRLVAYIVPRDAMPGAAELRDHLRTVLPAYMLPQHVLPIDAIPLLPNGKLDRRSLPAPSAQQAEPVAPMQQALAGIEAKLARIWEEQLGVTGVQASDNFFDLGGHSLLAVRVAARMERELGLRIDLRRMTYESLSQLAASASRPVAPPPSPAATAPAKKGLLDRLKGTLRPG